LQWQILFFAPATAGFYLDQIITYCRRIPSPVTLVAMLVALGSIVVSAIIILPHDPGTYSRSVFSKEPMALARIALSFTWFIALAWLFNKILPWLEKYLGWLLLPFGTRSLTAYIVHGFILTIIALVVPSSTSFILNTLYVCIAVLGTWAVVRNPAINRFVPR
jgi:fucose 4-O-acetylase-like acetyltransferase